VRQYSDNYQKQVNDLRAWFATRLPALGPIELSHAEIEGGIDSLTGEHKNLTDTAFNEWLTERNYELSYNQMCNAFFEAVCECDLLNIGQPTTPATEGVKK
jgi:hypothetical protein